ncbi:MAG: hypothetical protein ABIP41_01970 [Croceibacterium sp.]
MSPQERKLSTARAERDAALRLFKSDLVLVRADLHERGIGARIADRIGDGALDMADDALELAEANKGKVAAALAAAVLWFTRGPIIDSLGALFTEEKEPEPERLAVRLRALNPFSRE